MKADGPNESCQEIFASLSKYLDMELSPESCRELEAHLADCPPCIEFLASLRRSIALCRGYEPAELPRPLAEDARTQLQLAYRKMLEERQPLP